MESTCSFFFPAIRFGDLTKQNIFGNFTGMIEVDSSLGVARLVGVFTAQKIITENYKVFYYLRFAMKQCVF